MHQSLNTAEYGLEPQRCSPRLIIIRRRDDFWKPECIDEPNSSRRGLTCLRVRLAPAFSHGLPLRATPLLADPLPGFDSDFHNSQSRPPARLGDVESGCSLFAAVYRMHASDCPGTIIRPPPPLRQSRPHFFTLLPRALSRFELSGHPICGKWSAVFQPFAAAPALSANRDGQKGREEEEEQEGESEG
ncbi:hypothetical protein P4O66_017376, partial [Electrophorus voltai]